MHLSLILLKSLILLVTSVVQRTYNATMKNILSLALIIFGLWMVMTSWLIGGLRSTLQLMPILDSLFGSILAFQIVQQVQSLYSIILLFQELDITQGFFEQTVARRLLLWPNFTSNWLVRVNQVSNLKNVTSMGQVRRINVLSLGRVSLKNHVFGDGE